MKKIYRILTVNLLVIFMAVLMSACGESKLFTISFNSKGGTEVVAIVTDGKSDITMPSNPIKEGFTFDGWYFDDIIFASSLTVNSFMEHPISSDVTVYAKWTENEEIPVYTVTINPNYLDAITYNLQTENRFIESINTPVRAGYQFNGWWISDNGGITLTSQWDSQLVITRDIVLYADWVEESTTQGQLQAPAVTVVENQIGWQLVTGATGYDIVFSYKDNNQLVQYSSEFTINNYFQFDIYDSNIYTVKVRAKGNGTTSANSVYTSRTIYHRVLNNATDFAFDYSTGLLTWSEVTNADYYEIEYKTNATNIYTFLNSCYINECVIPETFNHNTYNFKITAQSSDDYVSSYTIYTLNYVKLATPVIDVNEETAMITWPSVPGANLYNLEIGGTQVTTTDNFYVLELSLGQAVDVKIRAFDTNTDYLASNWTSVLVEKLATPTISFIDGAFVWNEIEKASHYYIVVNDVGYGHVDESTYTMNFSKAGEITVTVRAVSLVNGILYSDYSNSVQVTIHSVTFVKNSNEPNTVRYIYDGGIVTQARPYKTGFTFAGWYTNSNFVTSWNEGTAISSSFMLYAKWQVNQYTITFDSNGGTFVNPITRNYTEYINAPTNPVKDNYVFSGWYTNDGEIKSFHFYTMPSRNITLFASWYTEGLSFSSLTGGYSVSKGTATASNVILPVVYGELPVLQIGSFSSYTSLYSVTIPNTITSISGSFGDCTNLTNVNFLPNSKLQNIGYGAFYNCSNLRTIVLPATIINIDSRAFSYCNLLETLVVNSLVPPTLGSDAFIGFRYGGTNYTSSSLWWVKIYVPSGSVDAYKSAVEWSKYSNKINSSSVTLDADGFIIDNGKLIQYVGNAISIKIPESVTTIGKYAFYNCELLQKIDMFDSVQIIEENALINCSSLSKINIGSGVTNIGVTAVYGCPKLTLIYLNRTVSMGITTSDYNSINGYYGGLLVFVPADSVEAYKNEAGWSSKKYCIYSKDIINDNGFVVEDNVLIKYFNNNNNNDEIIVPSNITSIRHCAFANLANDISLANTNITELITSSFQDYMGENIILPNYLDVINREAFINCVNLTSIIIPSSVTSISDTAFKNSGIWNNASNNSAVYAGNWLITYKGIVTDIVIPSNIVGIAHYALCGDSSLTSVTFSPNSQLKIIGVYAFANTSITEIIIPASVQTLSSYMFYNCTNFVEIYLEKPSSEGMIIGRNSMFYDCLSNLKIYVADEESLLAYKAAEYWSNYADIIFVKPI